MSLRRGTSAELAEMAATDVAMRKLGEQLAASAAISDIESFCQGLSRHKKSWWFDTKRVDERYAKDEAIHALIDQAVRYLDWRGLLIRRKGAPHVVTFRERA